MGFLGLSGVCFLCLAAMLVLRHLSPQMAPVAAALMGIAITFGAVFLLSDFVKWLGSFREESFGHYFDLLLKGLGISFLGATVSNACSDAGESGLARKTELVTSCAVIALCLPLLRELLEKALGLL